MPKPTVREIRILAIDPTTKGFGFAVLEGSDRLIDWGVKTVRGNKQAECLGKVRKLAEYYAAAVVALEDYKGRGSRRCPRVQHLIRAIRRWATKHRIKSRLISRAQVRRAFAPASTKQEIAAAIATRFPELAPLLPPPRKTWMSEDYRMNIFDAVALALTYFRVRNVRMVAASDAAFSGKGPTAIAAA